MKPADVHSRDLPSAHTLTWSSRWTWHAADLTLNKTHHNYCETLNDREPFVLPFLQDKQK